MTELIQVALLNIEDRDLHRRVYSPEGICPTIRAQSGGNAEPKVLIEGGPRMSPDYIEIPTWPEYNNQNRVYLGGGICPTLTTQCSHSKPPLVLVGGAE